VRASTRRLLEGMGHNVIAAATAAEALEHWAADSAIDVIVSDVVLRETTGPQVVECMLAQRNLRVLFISGYLDESQQHPLIQLAEFLPKPFGPEQLGLSLRRVLALPPLQRTPAAN
jgi:DNA-binding NtrC family response regulator